MSLEPPCYDGALIRRVRPPEIEGAKGDWTSRWLIRLCTPPSPRTLEDVQDQLNAGCHPDQVDLLALQAADVRLELRSRAHPLEPEAYPLIDNVLKAINGASGGIAEINGSPRDDWRTFREN